MSDAPALPRTWREPRAAILRFGGINPGVDHGADAWIVAELRRGNAVAACLIWIGAHSTAACGVRGFGRVPVPTRLTVVGPRGHWIASVADGGRLTRDRLATLAPIIDRHLGDGVAALLDPAWTTIVVDDGTGSGTAGTIAGRPSR